MLAILLNVCQVVDQIHRPRNEAEHQKACQRLRKGADSKEFYVEDKWNKNNTIFGPLSRSKCFDEGGQHKNLLGWNLEIT
jgi:hypothetical protein